MVDLLGKRGKEMEYLKMIGKTIIEYYKERYYSYESNEEGHKEENAQL